MATLVQAQEVVTSVNAVGYVKKTITKGEPSLLRQDFLTMDADPTPETIFGDTLPIGTKVYTWDGSSYTISEYRDDVFDLDLLQVVTNWNVEIMLDTGVGFWVILPDDAPEASYDVTLLGEVPNSGTESNEVSGLALVGHPYPVETSFKATDLASQGIIGDKAYFWDGQSYTVLEYRDDVFDLDLLQIVTNWNLDVTIALGEGFWYQRADATTIDWVEPQPYDL
jgi:hypothetical protein